MDHTRVFKCKGGTSQPWTYSVRKKCHFCREIFGEEREAALKQMMIPTPTNQASE